MQKSYTSDMARYWPMSHYNKHGKVIQPDVSYHGESFPARLYEYSHFPYTYAYDVPGVMTHPRSRSLYGRGLGSVSEYGYRSPHAVRSELFGYRYPPHITAEELEYYRDFYYPRYSRYRPSDELEFFRDVNFPQYSKHRPRFY